MHVRIANPRWSRKHLVRSPCPDVELDCTQWGWEMRVDVLSLRFYPLWIKSYKCYLWQWRSSWKDANWVYSTPRLCFYQTRSAWSMDQGSNKNRSPINNFTPTVTKFCVMWEGQALPHDTKFRNSRGKIVDSSTFCSWSLIHGSSWSGLIKAEPGITGPFSLAFFWMFWWSLPIFIYVPNCVIFQMPMNVSYR